MDPNSRNQQWSEWEFTVQLLWTPFFRVTHADVDANVARFMRKGFGSSSRMKIVRQQGVVEGVLRDRWIFTVQTEAANANDPGKRQYLLDNVTRFMENGLGRVRVTMEVRLLAGSPEDGRPAEQWLILPPSIITTAQIWGSSS